MRELNLLILIFIVSPILSLIHEVGHAFFVKIFGGSVDKIVIGTGKPIIKIGKFEIRALYFSCGMYFSSNLKVSNNFTHILISLGGIIFNLSFSFILFILMHFNIIPYNSILYGTMMFSLISALINSLPITLVDMDTDGKQLYLYFKNKNLEKLSNDTKTFPIFLEKVDKEINRLWEISMNTRFDYMRSKYIFMVMYKSEKLYNIGKIDEATLTLMSVDPDGFTKSPKLLTAYYNNLLYYLLLLNRLDEAEKIHYKLDELLKDNELIPSYIKDTLAIYEFFKGNFDKSKEMFLEIMSSSPDSQGKTPNYFLSQIYIKEDNIKEAIRLLNNIEESKVDPFIYNKVNTLKTSLEIS